MDALTFETTCSKFPWLSKKPIGRDFQALGRWRKLTLAICFGRKNKQLWYLNIIVTFVHYRSRNLEMKRSLLVSAHFKQIEQLTFRLLL
jgi:hypothetical protein